MPNFTKARRVPHTNVRRSVKRRRGGATTIEFALVLIVFLTLVLGMMDLAIGIFRSAILAQAAKTAAREAIVHGELADVLGVWDPSNVGPVSVQDLSHPIKDTIAPLLTGMVPSEVYVQVQWQDSANTMDDRVHVRIEHAYTPIVSFIFGGVEIPLVGSSTMKITH